MLVTWFTYNSNERDKTNGKLVHVDRLLCVGWEPRKKNRNWICCQTRAAFIRKDENEKTFSISTGRNGVPVNVKRYGVYVEPLITTGKPETIEGWGQVIGAFSPPPKPQWIEKLMRVTGKNLVLHIRGVTIK